ncbi:MAG: ABC transporter substrate-binding protein [Gammaproteobacteria bacterium]|nr:ABC transporter substrate-binding protein [Gammaproteobacteria bacterium]
MNQISPDIRLNLDANSQPGLNRAINKSRYRLCSFLLLLLCAQTGIPSSYAAWNNPYPKIDSQQNILYTSFSERPKHLDPVRSYSASEYAFIGQIYEPPLQYHFLKRPYELMPLTVEAMPSLHYFDAKDQALPASASSDQIAYSVYTLRIKPGIRYQPHPAFAREGSGQARYLSLTEADMENIHRLSDFKDNGTRELVAEDYVYQIKRLAHPKLNSPIQGLMSEYISGLTEYAETLKQAYQQQDSQNSFFDLRQYPLEGAKAIDRYTYQIKVKGRYPQLLYWLAMPFFAPMPYEADQFYSQVGMKERNITLDWYPVGTGAYMLTVNDPNLRMVMERNPNFHEEYYPSEGETGDRESGWLDDAGKRMPFVDKVIYSLEKESIPYWNKFLQGYYDVSGVSSDSFDQAIQFGAEGSAQLTDNMKAKDIHLSTNVETSIFYIGFNMMDPVVGGTSQSARLLRRAISIAIDFEEYISIFANGRGQTAQSVIPPGIFGHIEGEAGINPYIYDWVNNKPQRKPVSEAKRLLAEAGYPNGRDKETGKPLLIYMDITGGGPEDKSRFDWYRKQFRKIDLDLVIRNTDYNRFQEKMRKGNAQLFMMGWNADYPDPENFLFLLYGPNGKVKYHGENAVNYQNPEFDALFEQMKNMDNSPRRLDITNKMTAILREDAPWIPGFYPKRFVLHHGWYYNTKPNLMSHNYMMYKRIDPLKREQMRTQWNRPVLWPVVVTVFILIVTIVPAIVMYRRREKQPAVKTIR